MKKIAFILLSAMGLGAYAQKLPNVQQVSLRAPANIKIDGKVTEWGEKLQAYNNGTEIYYTIAHNAEYLYLTVQAIDIGIIDKIIAGGLAFTINTNGDKKAKNNTVVTFPVYEKGKTRLYLGLAKIKEIKNDAANSHMRLDSLKNAANAKIKSAFKFIATSGIKNITEEMVPIYNADGIAAAAMLDDNLHYNFELAIPLKLLRDNSTITKFTYNIQLNGYAFGGSDLRDLSGRFVVWVGADGQNYRMDDASPRSWSLATPSSFWGEYTLTK